jgi:hypothetical protein
MVKDTLQKDSRIAKKTKGVASILKALMTSIPNWPRCSFLREKIIGWFLKIRPRRTPKMAPRRTLMEKGILFDEFHRFLG